MLFRERKERIKRDVRNYCLFLFKNMNIKCNKYVIKMSLTN